MRQLIRRSSPVWEQKGTSLTETLVALALLGVIGVGFLTAVSTGSMATSTVNEQVTAESLARGLLEDTKNSPYLIAPNTYPTTVSPPQGYAVSIEAVSIPDTNDNIQKIRVTVSREGQDLLVVEDFKVNR